MDLAGWAPCFTLLRAVHLATRRCCGTGNQGQGAARSRTEPGKAQKRGPRSRQLLRQVALEEASLLVFASWTSRPDVFVVHVCLRPLRGQDGTTSVGIWELKDPVKSGICDVPKHCKTIGDTQKRYPSTNVLSLEGL